MAQEAADDASPPVEDKQSRLWFFDTHSLFKHSSIMNYSKIISTYFNIFYMIQSKSKEFKDEEWCCMMQNDTAWRIQ